MINIIRRQLVFSWAGALCVACCLIGPLQGQTVRLHGSVSWEKLVNAKKAEIESQAGVKVEVVGNGTGRGLADLISGQADMALIAGSLKANAESMNAEKAGSIDPSGMKEFPVTSVKVAFITHPSAGVKSLTASQLREVLTGKVTNWKDVGGADVPIKLVLPFTGDGLRVTLWHSLLERTDYAKNAITRNSAKDLSAVVAQVPGACAALSVKNVEGNVTTVPIDLELAMPMLVVVKGEPAGHLKKVVEAVQANIK